MPDIAKKQLVVTEIRDKIEKAKSVVLVDARGLTVVQDTELRKVLREADVDYKVYKNTMVNFAIKDTAAEGLAEYLKGPTAVAFSYDDATKAAGLISKHLKAMPNLEFKAGVIEGEVYDAAGMLQIAEIPSRDVLLSRLLGSFKSPMSSFARLIKQIAEKDGEEPVPAEEAAAEAPATAEAPAAEASPPVEAAAEAQAAAEVAAEAPAAAETTPPAEEIA